jgi:hypothetical protein
LRTGQEVVEIACERGDAIRTYRWVPFAVLGQFLGGGVGYPRLRLDRFRDRPSGDGVDVDAKDMGEVSRDIADRPRTD